MGIKKAWKRLLVVLLMLPPAVFADDLAGTAWDLKMNYNDHIRMMVLFEQNHTFSDLCDGGEKTRVEGFFDGGEGYEYRTYDNMVLLIKPKGREVCRIILHGKAGKESRREGKPNKALGRCIRPYSEVKGR